MIKPRKIFKTAKVRLYSAFSRRWIVIQEYEDHMNLCMAVKRIYRSKLRPAVAIEYLQR